MSAARRRPVHVLGLSFGYHESACCLLRDGRVEAAASEERFSRRKFDPALPVESFRYCLDEGGLAVCDVDAVAYYELPERKLSRQLWSGLTAESIDGLDRLDPHRPERLVRERLGVECQVLCFPHHLSHAASAYCFSGFPDAAVFTADGVGEWATTTYGLADRDGLELFEEVLFPHSLGLFYSTVTSYLGFAVNDGEYKVMGLAAYGEPRYLDQICQLIGMGDDGQFLLNPRYYDFLPSDAAQRMFSGALCELLGRPARRPGEAIDGFHRDVARSAQLLLEEILLEKLQWLHRRTGSDRLCMAGGVALNCAANGRIRRESPFRNVFVQPAAGDAGACLGAAALAHRNLTGGALEARRQRHTFLGPRIDVSRTRDVLTACDLEAADFRDDENALVEDVAERLAAGQIVGWVQGRMEHGPRALGARSLLAAPFDPATRDRINREIKRREDFRPFAPSVLLEHAAEYFDLDHPSPFMLETCPVLSDRLGAVTHVDGTARPQTVDRAVQPRFAALLEAFGRRTGCPVLLNTSLNGPGEPIVATAHDALWCFHRLGLDALVLEDFVIDRATLPATWDLLAPSLDRRPAPAPVDRHLYTFV